MPTLTTTPTKAQLIDALRKWIAQRPGLEFGNYGDVKAYRAESRDIQRDGQQARVLLGLVEHSDITVDELLEGMRRGYSGRLQWKDGELDYCTGQYWPTEYRRAVCSVCATTLWEHYRENYAASRREEESAGDAIRRRFRESVGRVIQKRWFD